MSGWRKEGLLNWFWGWTPLKEDRPKWKGAGREESDGWVLEFGKKKELWKKRVEIGLGYTGFSNCLIALLISCYSPDNVYNNYVTILSLIAVCRRAVQNVRHWRRVAAYFQWASQFLSISTL